MSLLIWKMTDIHFECIYSHIVFDISFGTDEFVFIIVYIFVVSGSVRFFGVHHDFGLANICAGCRAHSSGVPLRVEMAGTEEKSTDWVRSQEVSEPLQWVLKSFFTFDFFSGCVTETLVKFLTIERPFVWWIENQCSVFSKARYWFVYKKRAILLRMVWWRLHRSFQVHAHNHMPCKVWDEITYPFSNFNGCTVEVWEWMSNSIPHFLMDVTHPWR